MFQNNQCELSIFSKVNIFVDPNAAPMENEAISKYEVI